MNSLFLHCRPGFEGEVCRDIRPGRPTGRARLRQAGQCLCRVHLPGSARAERLMRGQRFSRLIFPRQWARGSFLALPETDRISCCWRIWPTTGVRQPVAGGAGHQRRQELSNFCKFEAPLRKALEKAGRLVDDPSRPRLLLTFRSGREVFAGVAEADNSALWPMGIPRLKFPARRRAAPR